MDKEKVNKLG